MKILLLVVGKTNIEYLSEGIEIFSKRLSHYLPFEICIIKDVKQKKDMKLLKNKEGEQIISFLKSGDQLILLDERGNEFTSVGFSGFIQRKMNEGSKRIIFVIGGAYGFSDDVYKRASGKIAMSKMTFSHQMIRLIFVEQLYRAMTIIKGEAYHHE